MPKIRELAMTDYADGVHIIHRRLTNGLDGFVVSIPRCTSAQPSIWPNASTKIHISVELGYGSSDVIFPSDGGGAEATAEGGILVNRGEEVPETTLSLVMPVNPKGIPIWARIIITVTGGPIRTAVDVAAN